MKLLLLSLCISLSLLFTCCLNKHIDKKKAIFIDIPPDQDSFAQLLKEADKISNKENQFKCAELADSIINRLDLIADTSIILSWVGVINDFKANFDDGVPGCKNCISFEVSINPLPLEVPYTLSSDLVIDKDSSKNNFMYNQLKGINLKNGDTVRFDGLFSLYSQAKRVAINHIYDPLGRNDLMLPWLKFDITYITPYHENLDSNVIKFKKSTDSVYKYARLICNKGLYNSDDAKVSLNKVTSEIEAESKGKELESIKYLISRRVLRELLLIK